MFGIQTPTVFFAEIERKNYLVKFKNYFFLKSAFGLKANVMGKKTVFQLLREATADFIIKSRPKH